MAKFTKAILKAGKYLTSDPKNPASRVETEISKDRLVHWVEQFNRMKQEGLRIPAPLRHSASSVPFDSKAADAERNSGFWESVWYGHDEKGVPTLYGRLEAPGDKNDARTMAGKISKTVKETSIYTAPEFVSGKNTKYEDAILHIACVVNPIEPGQEDFKPEQTLAMSMSMNGEEDEVESENESGESIKMPEVLTLLKERAGISLPENVSGEDFLKYLHVALLQLEPVETNNIKTPPAGSKEKEVPLAMSMLTKEQIQSIIDAKVTNPATGKPFASEELNLTPEPVQMSQEHQQALETATQTNAVLMSHLKAVKQVELSRRLHKLVACGLDKDYAEKQLAPQIQALQMSFDVQGQMIPQPIESTLAGMEAMAPKNQKPAFSVPLFGSLGEALNGLSMSMTPPAEVQVPGGSDEVDVDATVKALLASL